MIWSAHDNWIRDQQGRIVATVSGNWSENGYTPEALQRYRAKLLAAAPDMFVQLTEVWASARANVVPSEEQIQKIEEILGRIDAR